MLLNRKCGPDARLQRLQPRLGDRRRQRPRAQAEIAEQHAATQSANSRCRSSAERRLGKQTADERVDREPVRA